MTETSLGQVRERARLLVIQHEDEAPAAWFGEWLEAAGAGLAVVLAHRGEPVPDTIDGYDGLLVLGGAMGASDDDQNRWLTPTKRLIAATVRGGREAFLGICLGHQLAAVALGGSVGRNPAGRALGLTPVRLCADGRADRLLGGVSPDAQAAQWNDDIVTTMPLGSSVLAVAPDGSVQAARFGPRAWGVQFHPEVSPDVFASWGVVGEKSDQPAAEQEKIARAVGQVAAAEQQLRATWRPVAERFANIAASVAPTAS
jgi:GMP synthase (glutamine-hydrolysing)